MVDGIDCSIVFPELINEVTNAADPGLITPAASNCCGDCAILPMTATPFTTPAPNLTAAAPGPV